MIILIFIWTLGEPTDDQPFVSGNDKSSEYDPNLYLYSVSIAFLILLILLILTVFAIVLNMKHVIYSEMNRKNWIRGPEHRRSYRRCSTMKIRFQPPQIQIRSRPHLQLEWVIIH